MIRYPYTKTDRSPNRIETGWKIFKAQEAWFGLGLGTRARGQNQAKSEGRRSSRAKKPGHSKSVFWTKVAAHKKLKLFGKTISCRN